MNKEEIRDLLDAITWMDFRGISKYSDIPVTEDNPLDIERTKQEQILRNIMSKIENGDYEYFTSQRSNKKYRKAYLFLMTYSNRIDDIKKCIEEYKEQKMSSSILKRLIIATHDTDYIKSIIEDDRTRYNMGFWTGDLIDLISATEDIDYIKLFIEDEERIERFGFDNFDLLELIKVTKDESYIKSFIEDSQKRELYDFDEDFVAELIAELDPQYIKEVLNNQEKIVEYGLNAYNLVELLKATKDYQFIKSIIEDDEKRKNLNMSSQDVIELVIATGNQKYILDILEGRNKVISQLLDEKSLANILFITQGKEYIKANAKKYVPSWDNTPYYEHKKINLPEQMTVGIEIETEGWQSKAIRRLTNIIEDGWTCKNDASLSNGVEVTSPILTGDFDKASREVMQVCTRLEALRTTCNRILWRTYTHRS